ncbi:hypothetical protein TD95_002023 [Thielaviopsis punctulata]|uniref:Hemerythrin-like domain-containing protein n=1 Tax=Thielaviopsis punctulata TaxID=72032 RepID=A0A0F4ZC28_9PEZI|nr:hypothetical protein TD95_002023 [Thielaviopsis punctulata]
MHGSPAPTAPAQDPAPVQDLPPLSDHDFRQYNRLAVEMEYYHNHFREAWSTMATACANSRLPKTMTQRQFLNIGLRFTGHLAGHHAIEEAHLFPALARRMPEFSKKNQGLLVRQHKAIHRGLDALEGYLHKCLEGSESLDLQKLAGLMEWGDTLFEHLDEEVRLIGAENMRRYWTKEEIMRIRM